MSGAVRLEIDGPVAVLTNDNPDRHNAFDDAMDTQLFDALDEVAGCTDVRVLVWRGEGPSFSSGRDVDAIRHPQLDLTHHELMQRAHDGARRLLDLDVPVIAAVHGWTMGVSFQRALLADIRIAAEGTRFRLPELAHGFIPDGGGVARLHQMCGHGVVSDLVLTGRTMEVDEAFGHGIVSRVVPSDDLHDTARDMADRIATTPAATVKMARSIIAHLASPLVAASMAEEMIAQTVIATSADYAEFRLAKREDRVPTYRGS